MNRTYKNAIAIIISIVIGVGLFVLIHLDIEDKNSLEIDRLYNEIKSRDHHLRALRSDSTRMSGELVTMKSKDSINSINLKNLLAREANYERNQIRTILTYSDPVMDSLWFDLYPRTDEELRATSPASGLSGHH